MNVIDLFAGAGGFSTGALMAGCRVVWAANHWQSAVEVHAINHPGAAMVYASVCNSLGTLSGFVQATTAAARVMGEAS